MLECWDGRNLEGAAQAVFPFLRAYTRNGKHERVFRPLAQLLTQEDRPRIEAWFHGDGTSAGHAMRSFDTFAVAETEGGTATANVFRREIAGLLFLALATFEAAESLDDGRLWPLVRRKLSKDAADALLPGGHPSEDLKLALKRATERFGLPHAFAGSERDNQRYYQTVRVNCGASRADLRHLTTWARASNDARLEVPFWFRQWREKSKDFADLLTKMAAGKLAPPQLLAEARDNFPLLAIDAESFRAVPVPNAAGAANAAAPANVSPIDDDGGRLPLRLRWNEHGLPALDLDLDAWAGAEAATEIEGDAGVAERDESRWRGRAVSDGHWFALGLAAAPTVEVNGVGQTLAVAAQSPLYFGHDGAPRASAQGAQCVIAWTPLRSTGTRPHRSPKHGAWVALLDGVVETEDGQILSVAGSPAASPTVVAKPPRITEVRGTPSEGLSLRLVADDPADRLVAASIGDTELVATGEGHDVVFESRGPVEAAITAGSLRVFVEWKSASSRGGAGGAGATRTRTLDVPLPTHALAVAGVWQPLGGPLEARALRERQVTVAAGKAALEGSSPTLTLVAGSTVQTLRDRLRPLEVWGLGEPLLLVDRSAHAGEVFAEVASGVVDHGDLLADPAGSAGGELASTVTLRRTRNATEAWALVWERDGSCSAVALAPTLGDELRADEPLAVPTQQPRPRAIVLCRATAWRGAVWASDWDEGLCALAAPGSPGGPGGHLTPRALMAVLLATRVPVLASPEVARLLDQHPVAAFEWAAKDALELDGIDPETAFDVVVGERRLKAPDRTGEVLTELCLDLRLGQVDARARMPRVADAKAQATAFYQIALRMAEVGPRVLIEFVRQSHCRDNQARAALGGHEWTVLTVDQPRLRRTLAADAKRFPEEARRALSLKSPDQFALLEHDGADHLNEGADRPPLSPRLRSAFRTRAMSRHLANTLISALRPRGN